MSDDLDEAIEAARLWLNEHFHAGQPGYVAAGHEGPAEECCWCQESAEKSVEAAAPIIRRPVERERDEAREAADDYALQFQTEAELAKTTAKLLARAEAERDAARGVLDTEGHRRQPLHEEIAALRARLADAERDALNRAADATESWVTSPPTRELCAAWLRERAKATKRGN